MLSKAIVLMAILLSVNAYAATDAPHHTVGSKTIDSVLDIMKVEEKLSLEIRYDNLRKQFLGKLVEALDKCSACKAEFPDTDKEGINEAADIYIKDLKERESHNVHPN